MNDERLQTLLGSLRHERMDRVADERTRARLEHAWTSRQERRSWSFRVRRLVPVLATLALIAGLTSATLRASGDSPLYGVRVVLEDAAAGLYADPQDRASYLLALLDQRQAEAARLEAAGNALAASRVRAVEQNTLRLVRATIPEAPEVAPAPEATETPSPSPSPTESPSPSPSPTPEPTVAPTAAPTARPATPRPTTTRTATPTPRPSATPPAPTGTPFAVTFTGRVKNPDGTLAANVCVRNDPNSPTCLRTTGADGLYTLTLSAKLNQTVTLYFTRQDGAILYKGFVSAVVKGTHVAMPDAKLQK